MYRLAVLFCLFILQTGAAGAPNGCGSGWNVWVVPNSIPLLQCRFADCCNQHDVCYGNCEGRTEGECAYMRCRKGGDLYRSDRCVEDEMFVRSAIDAQNRKRVCDNKFYASMRAANHGKFVCEALAIVYRDAVKAWGDGAFSGLDEVNPPKAWEQSKPEYDAALRDFFVSGSEEQFKDFVRQADSHAGETDLNAPLRYDQKNGLINVEAKK